MKKLEFINLEACDEASDWASGKTWQEIYSTCDRGDWLLWLFAKTNAENIRELTLAKGHCANTVRHLMNDKRSIAAVDAAIAYGEGQITDEELCDAANDASAAYAYATADAAYAAYAAADAYAAAYAAADDAAYAAAYAAADAAYAAADDATYAAAYASSAAKKENQKQTADICRKYLPIEMWNI